MSWRLVRSLERLREQINAAYPGRSKASDGTIGDAAHASRKSDHNPEADGTVDAMDITHDPAHGLDIQRLADALLASRDPRIGYIICNRRIAAGRKGPSPWTWRRYRGANPHTRHMHISVLDERQDDASPWRVALASVAPDDSVLRNGSTGPFVRELQANLNRLGFGPLKEDGEFGAATERALRAFQARAGLKADGWAGPRTLKAIGEALKAQAAMPKVDAAEQKVEEKTTLWTKVSGWFGGGGISGGIGMWLAGMDWRTVLAVAGAGVGAAIVILIIVLLFRRQIIGAVRDIRQAVEQG